MKFTEEIHYINTIYYKIEQAAKYCKQLGTQIFEKLQLPMTLDEFTTLDTISIYGEICQRDLAKLILKDNEYFTSDGQNVKDLLIDGIKKNNSVGIDFKGVAFNYVIGT